LRRALERPLVWAAAFSCFALLVVVTALPSLLALDPVRIATFAPPSGVLFMCVSVAVALASGALGLPVARFLLRVRPVRLADEVQRRSTWIGVLFIVALLFATYSLLGLDANEGRGFAGMWFDAAAPIEVKWAGVSAIVLFAMGATLPFLLRHLQPRRFRQRPFVLFLRRFSTFSDGSVMNELLRRCPSGKPLVFLVPTRSAARDWNPFQIGFAGLRLLSPFRSLPVAVSATDAAWKAAAKELVASAETIVLDGSFGSESIAYEVDMLQTLGAVDKTVVLMLANDGKNSADRPAASLQQTATFITYRKSWLRALPRLFLGIPTSAFPAIYLSAVPGAIWLGALSVLRQDGRADHGRPPGLSGWTHERPRTRRRHDAVGLLGAVPQARDRRADRPATGGTAALEWEGAGREGRAGVIAESDLEWSRGVTWLSS